MIVIKKIKLFRHKKALFFCEKSVLKPIIAGISLPEFDLDKELSPKRDFQPWSSNKTVEIILFPDPILLPESDLEKELFFKRDFQPWSSNEIVEIIADTPEDVKAFTDAFASAARSNYDPYEHPYDNPYSKQQLNE